jgi:Nuclease-related domain
MKPFEVPPLPFTLPSLDLETIAYLLGAAALIAGLLLLWRGYRSMRARKILLAAVTSSSFDYLRDVLLPDGQGGWLHVDFLLLTARGVVIIDLRYVVGNIFGGDQMNEWTVMQRGRRFTFVNPQTALYDRLAAVRALVSELPVDGRILFMGGALFPKGLPRFTLMLDSLLSEYPAVDRIAVAALLAGWQGEWDQLRAACVPSRLSDPKPAV